MSEEKIKTTNSDFETYRKEIQRLIDIFGLKGWHLFFRHESLNDSFAEIRYNMSARNAVFVLNTEFDTIDYSEDQIKRSAFHEVCELLLARISNLAKFRYTTEEEIDEEIHNIIRILENTVFAK